MTDVVREKTTPGGLVAYLLAQFFGLKNPVGIWDTVGKAMKTANIDWRDIGNLVNSAFKRIAATAGWSLHDILDLIENGITKAEMQKLSKIIRAEGFEAGVKVGGAGAGNGHNNHSGSEYSLPGARGMVEYCYQHLSRITDDWPRNFVTDMHARFARGTSKQLSRRQLGNLMRIYVEFGGEI